MTVDLPTTERTTDVEAWRQRMEAKGAKARGFAEREQAAMVSQLGRKRTDPPAPRVAPAPAPQPAPGKPGRKRVIAPCTAGCGRMTRSGSCPADAAPGTVQRTTGGKCTTCHRKEAGR